jgi:hypothetical protein
MKKNIEMVVLVVGTLLATCLGLSYNYYSEYKEDRNYVEHILNEIDSTIYSVEYSIDTLDNFSNIITKFESIKQKTDNIALKRVLESKKYDAIITNQKSIVNMVSNSDHECEIKKNELMYYYLLSKEKKRLSKSLDKIKELRIRQEMLLQNLIKEKSLKILSGNF